MIITIDGGAASGKSSVCTQLSRMYEYTAVHTGHAYRAVCKHILLHAIPVHDVSAIVQYAEGMKLIEKNYTLIIADYSDGTLLHNTQIEGIISEVAAIQRLRAVINTKFRQNCSNQNTYVVEGRDAGTNIFPNAAAKFFLKADADIRVHRRLKQGYINISEAEELKRTLLERDEKDAKNTQGALTIGKDMHIVDTGFLTIFEVCEKIKKILISKGIDSNGQ